MSGTGESFVQLSLFGGAVKLVLPQRFEDVSDFRTVPDHQEVFTDASHDQSLIVEIVEFQDQPDEDAAAFFFRDLAEVGGAQAARLQAVQGLSAREVPHLPPDLYVSVAAGQQTLAKGGAGAAPRDLQVLLADIRIPKHSSDLLLTLHTPAATGDSPEEGAVGSAALAPELFKKVLASLQILDWGLFGA